MAGSCGDSDADHLHVVAPSERDARLGNFSAALKRWMREELDASWEWQSGCFDRLLRSDESLHEKWLYLQENPVRAGLIQDWKIGHNASSLTSKNDCGEALRLLNLSPIYTNARQATRLPYN